MCRDTISTNLTIHYVFVSGTTTQELPSSRHSVSCEAAKKGKPKIGRSTAREGNYLNVW